MEFPILMAVSLAFGGAECSASHSTFHGILDGTPDARCACLRKPPIRFMPPLPTPPSRAISAATGRVFEWNWHGPLPAATLRAEMAAGKEIDVRSADGADPIRVTGELDCSSLTIKGRVRLRGVRFEGFVNLRDGRFEKEADFSGCEFSAGLSLRGARVDGSLDLEMAVFGSEGDLEVDANGLRVEGTLNCAATRFGSEGKAVSLDLSNARIGEDLLLWCARISGGLSLLGADIARNFSLIRVSADYPRTWIGGDFMAVGCHVGGQMTAAGIRIEGTANFQVARLDGVVDFGINPVDAEPAHLGTAPLDGRDGGVVLLLGFAVVGGFVNLNGMRLEGQLNLNGAVLKGSLLCQAQGTAVPHFGKAADGISVSANSAFFGAMVNFDGAHLEGQLYLEVATLKAPLFCRATVCRAGNESKVVQPWIGSADGVSVRAHAASFGGPVEFCGAHLEGQMHLGAAELKAELRCHGLNGAVSRIGKDDYGVSVCIDVATIGGQVIFDGACLEGQLKLDGAELKAGLFCAEQNGLATWIGKGADSISVQARSATIGGQVVFDGARLEGQLNLDGTTVEAHWICRERNGTVPRIGKDETGVSVWANGATIGGQVIFTGAHLEGQLNLNGAVLKADFLCEGRNGAVAWIGEDEAGVSVWAYGATIGGQMALTGAHLEGQLNLDGAEVKSRLLFGQNRIYGRTWVGGGVTAKNIVVGNDVQFRGVCCGQSFLWSGAAIDGSFDAADAVIGWWTDFSSTEVKDWMRFDGADFGDTVDLTGALIENELAFGGGTFNRIGAEPGTRTRLRGGLKLLRTEVRGDLVFRRCDVGPWNNMENPDWSRLRGQEDVRVCQSTVIAGERHVHALQEHLEDVSRQETANPETAPTLRLRRELLETLLKEANEELDLRREKLKEAREKLSEGAGGVSMPETSGPWSKETEIEKAVARLAACEGNRDDAAVEDERSELETLVEKAEQDHPAMDFRHLSVMGRLLWNASQEMGQNGDTSEVGGCVNAGSLNAEGDVRLNGVTIRGSLVLEDAVVRGELNLLRSEIRGHLNLRSAEVRGQMFGRLAKAEISPRVRGMLLLNAAKLSEVMLRFSTTAGENGSGPVPYRVDMSHAKVERLVPGGTVEPGQEPRLWLEGLQFGELDVEKLGKPDRGRTRWWPFLRQAVIHGWRGPSEEARPYLVFLEQMGTFNAAVYAETERWLRNRGRENAADDVYLMMRGMEWKEAARKTPQTDWTAAFRKQGRWMLHGFLLATVGYGVKTYRLIVIWLALFAAMIVMFLDPASVSHPMTFQAPLVAGKTPLPARMMVELPSAEIQGRVTPLPTQAKPEAQEETQPPSESGNMPEGWQLQWKHPHSTVEGELHTEPPLTDRSTELVWSDSRGYPGPADANDPMRGSDWNLPDAGWMAFRATMPLIEVFARNDWEPSSRPVVGLHWFSYEGIASLARVLCYIIWPLLITSWTGLLKKR